MYVYLPRLNYQPGPIHMLYVWNTCIYFFPMYIDRIHEILYNYDIKNDL